MVQSTMTSMALGAGSTVSFACSVSLIDALQSSPLLADALIAFRPVVVESRTQDHLYRALRFWSQAHALLRFHLGFVVDLEHKLT